MKTPPAISVVIPVYNVEKYLRTCLDSVCRQTFSDFEAVCVDDGSTDGSPEILREYERRDTRFRVITQRNGGLSFARNTGMDAARGKYIYFLDSDDWLRPDALEKSFVFAERFQLEQVVFASEVVADDDWLGSITELEKKRFSYSLEQEWNERRLPGVELMAFLRKTGRFFVGAPFRLMRLDYLRDARLRFPEGILHEDQFFTPLSLALAKEAGVLAERLYFRRLHSGSITSAEGYSRKIVKVASLMANGVWLRQATEGLRTDQREELAYRLKRLEVLCARYVCEEQRRSRFIGEAATWAKHLDHMDPRRLRQMVERVRIVCFKRRLKRLIRRLSGMFSERKCFR